MSQPTASQETPGQTVGPFYGFALPYDGDNQLVDASHPAAVRLHGTVTDGAGEPIPDALLEIWQPDGSGAIVQEQGSLARDGHTFTGFGRVATDNAGRYWFTTIEPGATGDAAPFIAMAVFARGLLNRLFTRIYLPEAGTALDTDGLLSSLPKDRRHTLIAVWDPDGGLCFDVRLQGEGETVFLTHAAQ